MKTLDVRSGGLGDCIVGLWIAEGIKRNAEDVAVLAGSYASVVEAFGFQNTETPLGEVLGLGGEHPSYSQEIAEGPTQQDRTVRWQNAVSWAYKPLRPPLGALPQESIDWAKKTAANRRTEANRPLALIFPKANYESRSWPFHKWIRLASHMEAEGWSTIALDHTENRVKDMPFYVWGFPYTHIMALMLEADIVIGNDSGMPHLAGTLGVPTVAVMGPTDPHTVFGYCEDVHTVRAEEVPCVGCHFAYAKGYTNICDNYGCEALQVLPWTRVWNKVLMLCDEGIISCK